MSPPLPQLIFVGVYILSGKQHHAGGAPVLTVKKINKVHPLLVDDSTPRPTAEEVPEFENPAEALVDAFDDLVSKQDPLTPRPPVPPQADASNTLAPRRPGQYSNLVEQLEHKQQQRQGQAGGHGVDVEAGTIPAHQPGPQACDRQGQPAAWDEASLLSSRASAEPSLPMLSPRASADPSLPMLAHEYNNPAGSLRSAWDALGEIDAHSGSPSPEQPPGQLPAPSQQQPSAEAQSVPSPQQQQQQQQPQRAPLPAAWHTPAPRLRGVALPRLPSSNSFSNSPGLPPSASDSLPRRVSADPGARGIPLEATVAPPGQVGSRQDSSSSAGTGAGQPTGLARP